MREQASRIVFILRSHSFDAREATMSLKRTSNDLSLIFFWAAVDTLNYFAASAGNLGWRRRFSHIRQPGV